MKDGFEGESEGGAEVVSVGQKTAEILRDVAKEALSRGVLLVEVQEDGGTKSNAAEEGRGQPLLASRLPRPQGPGRPIREPIFDNRSPKDVRGFDPLLSPQDAARYLGVARKFIYERITRKEIEAQPLGRLKRIRLSALETWLLREKQRR